LGDFQGIGEVRGKKVKTHPESPQKSKEIETANQSERDAKGCKKIRRGEQKVTRKRFGEENRRTKGKSPVKGKEGAKKKMRSTRGGSMHSTRRKITKGSITPPAVMKNQGKSS